MSIRRAAAAALGLTVVLAGGPAGAKSAPAPLSRISVSSAGAQGNGLSDGHRISANGRYVSFASSASNLVPGDTNGTHDVFVRDLRTGTTTRVSVSGRGAQGNGASAATAISAGGRYMLFGSNTTNLVPGTDANGGNPDVFVRDLLTTRTVRVNVSTKGVQSSDYASGVAISTDGRYVTFTSQAANLVPGDTNGSFDAFVRDRLKGTTTRVSLPTGTGGQGDGHSFARAMSADGRYVAFASGMPGDSNQHRDVFVRDRRAGTTTLDQRVGHGRGGRRPEPRAEHERRRPQRRLLLRGHQPRAGRHQRRLRRLPVARRPAVGAPVPG